MIPSARHGSVWTKARRSDGGAVESRRSSSVSAVRGESGECCDMVILDVVKEWRKADVSGAGVGHDGSGGEMAHRGVWVRGRQHDDCRALLGGRRHLGPEPLIGGARNEVFDEPGGYAPDRGHPNLLDILEPAELRVDRGEGGGPELEAARVVVKLERARLEGELVLVTEPPPDGRYDAGLGVVAHVAGDDPPPAEQPLQPAGDEEVHSSERRVD